MLAIPGIRYVPGYVDSETQAQLLAAVDAQPGLTSVDHRVQVYGFHYSHRTREAFRMGDLPAWATSLATRLQDDGLIAGTPNQLVANEYEPGTGFFDHIDQSVFGDVVVSLSLGSTCAMRFSRSDTEASLEVLLEPGSVLVLSGEARWDWKHGIPARASDLWQGQVYPRARRISLTFRAVPERH